MPSKLPANLAIHKRDEVTVIALYGDFDDVDQNVRDSFFEALNSVPPRVVVDLASCRFLSYQMVGFLVEQRRQFENRAGWMRLASVRAQQQRFFRLCAVHKILAGYGTVSDAITDNGAVALPSEQPV